MSYRTRTYIAGDWDHDIDAVTKLYDWNNSNYWSLSFTNAHDLTSARDDSLNCSIKASLKSRMDCSKTFVLIVGDHTNRVTAGSCSYCQSYNSYTYACARGRSVDYRSYIKYECDKAVEAGIKIIVLYKSTWADKNKCPEAVRNKGIHVPMKKYDANWNVVWDYINVKKAFDE